MIGVGVDKAAACGPTSGKKPLMTMARSPPSDITYWLPVTSLSLSDKKVSGYMINIVLN